MEKYKTFLIFLVILLLLPIIYKATKKTHTVTYQVNEYQVEENFKLENKIHTYDFYITKGKEEYSFQIDNKINKRTKIIKDIKVYKQNNLTCIVPIYKNKKKGDLYCRKDNLQVSKEVLKNNKDYKKILSSALKYIENDEVKEKKKSYDNITIYHTNIPKDNALIIWNYKGIDLITSTTKKSISFIDYDLYDNIEATVTSNYFVLLENTKVEGIEKVHCYDIEKDKYKVITLEEKLSKNSYINGSIKDKVYITDKKKKKEYTLDIKKEELKEITTEDEKYIKYIDSKEKLLSKSDFFIKNQYFKNERIEDKNITESKDLVQDNHIYYFKEDNNIYRQIEGRNKVLLFNIDNIDEWNVVNNKIIYKVEDKLYLFEENTGIKQLIEYNELKYNDENIYYLWK